MNQSKIHQVRRCRSVFLLSLAISQFRGQTVTRKYLALGSASPTLASSTVSSILKPHLPNDCLRSKSRTFKAGAIIESIVAAFFVSRLVAHLIAYFIRKTGLPLNPETKPLNLIFLYILLIPILAALGGWLHKRSLRKMMPGYLEKLREWSSGMICCRCGYTWNTQKNCHCMKPFSRFFTSLGRYQQKMSNADCNLSCAINQSAILFENRLLSSNFNNI